MNILRAQHRIALSIVCALVVAIWIAPYANASYTLEALPEKTVYNDFVVGPGKVEVELAPGETQTFELTVSNRLGTDKTFNLSEEDFTGSRSTTQTVVLLGDDRGPYSLKDYIHIGAAQIDIPHANKARVPVTISIPADAQPGGLYGSVIVGTATKKDDSVVTSGAAPTSPIVTRIGTLFFVRVKGPVNQNGKLTTFMIDGNKTLLFDSSSITFDFLYENNGNVHNDPYGTVTISNMLGSQVAGVDIDPWFAMPNSVRLRQVIWTPPFLFGRYVAHASINRGFGSTTDEVSIAFWVIPWKAILIVILGLAIVIGFFKWIFSKFSIVAKK